jgi:hypothetical protein
MRVLVKQVDNGPVGRLQLMRAGYHTVDQARLLNDQRAGTEYAHTLRDFFGQQASIRVISHDGRAWHGRHLRFFRVLDESRAAVFLDRPQTGGPVVAAAAQNNAHNPLTVGNGRGNK